MFTADYPGAIVVPSHPTNQHTPESHGGVSNQPKAWFLHTPEEDADDNEGTPYYFANNANLEASTHYYMDSDGDVYQCVPERNYAYANGLNGKPLPSWADPSTSLNWQSLSVEIEGRAASIHDTMPIGGPQWNGLIKLIKHRAAAYNIPLDREHIMGHYQVSTARTDPGPKFPWDALMRDLKGAEMRIEHQRSAGFLGNNFFANGIDFSGVQHVDAAVDFALPPEAKYAEIEFLAQHGFALIKSGSGIECGKIGWGLTGPSRSVCTIGLSDTGPANESGKWFSIEAPEDGNKLFIIEAKSIAYLT